MLIVYASLTRKTERFVKKLELPCVKINENLEVNEPFVLVTYTIGFGEVPAIVQKFLERSGDNMKAVASGGNKLWGANFAKSGEVISKDFNVPLLHKFELSGTKQDVETFKERLLEIGKVGG